MSEQRKSGGSIDNCRRMAAVAGALTVAAVLGPADLGAQYSEYRVLPEAEEIALAQSAAPSSVSADADIWVVRAGRYQRAVEGSNGNACMVMRLLRGHAEALGPICYDAEAYRTIMPMHVRAFELRLQGKPTEDVDAALAEEFGSGSLPGPRRPAMTYMMSAGQHLFSGSGQDVGNWKPHIMLYVPFVTTATVGLSENGESVMVVNGGKPNAFLAVVVPDFIEPTYTESDP